MRAASQALTHGKIIAYPTEAVFGLGCDPFNHEAVQRLFQLKQRPLTKSMILLAPTMACVKNYTAPLAEDIYHKIEASWPGPVTWIFPANENLPTWLMGADNTIAIRITAHPVAASLVASWGTLLVSTSANISSLPPAKTAKEVEHYFANKVDYILDAAVGGALNPSEIRDARSGVVVRKS
jgi:L-threonylcarbamoyladenylate synthase